MIEATLFHPVADAADLGERPLGVRLLDTDVVLWRDADGVVRAFADRCPHRGAALSLGRVHGGELECPYHGWRFDGAGQCVAVPAVPQFRPPREHRACAYTAREGHGLVWVALQGEATGELPAFAAEADERLRKVNCGPYDVEASAPRIVENFLDMAHFGFVHEGWLGSREATTLEPYKVQSTPTGFIATECRAWQPQSSIEAKQGAFVEYTYEVNAPYTCVLTKVPDAATVGVADFRESIALFVCPLAPERSRVWMRMAMTRSGAADEELRRFQDTIFGQDRPVLESQRPKRLPIGLDGPVTELHSAADRSAAAYRRYLRECGVTYGVC